MHYNTLILNTYKVKLLLINFLLKILEFKELVSPSTVNIHNFVGWGLTNWSVLQYTQLFQLN